MDYAEAFAISQKKRPTVLVSYAGGRSRYAKLRFDGYDVVATLFRTDIVRWKQDGSIVLNSGGFRTATTKEAINFLLWQFTVYAEKGVWYAKGQKFEDGMTINPVAP